MASDAIRLDAVVAKLEAALYAERRRNEQLTEQLRDTRERLAALELRLHGNNEIRRIAARDGVPQAEVIRRFEAWMRTVE